MRQRGYVLVDHSASPGLPEDIARQAGYLPILAKEGRRFEADTFSCSHCKTVVVKNPLRERERPFCHKCNHEICDGCHFLTTLPDYVHVPYVKIVEENRSGKTTEVVGNPHLTLLTP